LRSLFVARTPAVEARIPDCRNNVENGPRRRSVAGGPAAPVSRMRRAVLGAKFCQAQNSLCVQVLPSASYIGSVTARHSSSGRQPNFAAWYKEWNYGTFAEGATYIWLGGHHVGHRPTF